jgi:hypothetical protein
MPNRERLQEAIRQIEAAAGSLNSGGHTCGACGLRVRDNWSEHQAAVTLQGVVNKLERTMEAPNLQAWLEAHDPGAEGRTRR